MFRKKKQRRREADKAIIALSPSNELCKGKVSSDFNKYKVFLDSAFQNSGVRNIAITGNYGVGKSSILRSYESIDKKRGDGYLYISLMDFNNDQGTNQAQHVQDAEDEPKGKTKLQQDFERYLLCQILSRVDAQDLPHSTFRLIPSRGVRKAIITSVLVAILVLCVFVISCNSVLELSEAWIRTLHYVCAGLGTVLVLAGSYIICQNVTMAKITATYKGMKLETESRQTTGSYIDDHVFEIVYALESLSKEIGYTVVLEDMDRLGRNICVDIFSKLRRINYLVNDRKNLRGGHLRFVYVFDDSIFELTKNTKFFDYVMSVTPKLNNATAGQYFKKIITDALAEDNAEYSEIAPIIAHYEAGFWEHIGMVIHDYRMINHIRNDFLLFVNVMCNRGFKPDEKWLPFVIYKNVLPEDYCRALECDGILELKKDERNKRIEMLCSDKGDHYSHLVKILFSYLIDELKLDAADFYRFTGMPKQMVKIRQEAISYSITKELMKNEVKQDHELIGGCVEGKKILITGGGSIGRELCRQLTQYAIQTLVIVDVSENNAYEAEQLISREYPNLTANIEIASICDKVRMEEIFKKYTPDIVFHTAAYMNVPIMENNPEEAIKTNVLGTYIVMSCAERNKAEKFVLLSTDKAQNPSNIYGATKRICELMLRLWQNSETVFCAVRFGNLLDKNGPMINRIRNQIEQGGPVTLMDSRLIRFILTIPDACQLILQATAIANHQDLLVLDMGQPIRIQDLVESFIRLAGLEPYKDIDIVYTGLRPGEKLFEELLVDDDSLYETPRDRIFARISRDTIEVTDIKNCLAGLNKAIDTREDRTALIDLICSLVPTYNKTR